MPNVSIYTEQGGKRMVIGQGATLVIEGDLEVEGGGAIDVPDASITTAKLANTAVTKAKAKMFISANQVGTGAPQNIAHGLGVDPTAANVIFSVIDTAAAGDFAFTNIATTNVNVTVTATANVVYRVQVWAP